MTCRLYCSLTFIQCMGLSCWRLGIPKCVARQTSIVYTRRALATAVEHNENGISLIPDLSLTLAEVVSQAFTDTIKSAYSSYRSTCLNNYSDREMEVKSHRRLWTFQKNISMPTALRRTGVLAIERPNLQYLSICLL